MRFTSTVIPGVLIVDVEPHADARGSLARAFCSEEFEAWGIDPVIAQMNLNHSHQAGTIRGLHLQQQPHAETKLVRCIRGAAFDVAVDPRPGSPTYRRWVGVELSPENRRALVVPAGCAHGFQTLADDTELLYTVSRAYAPDHEMGYHHADPSFDIRWPLEVASVSEKDAAWPLLGP